MVITYIALLAIILWGLRLRSKDSAREYLSIEQTKAVQGIFVILVVLSHFSTYVDMSNANIADAIFVFINNRISQLMVAMFLFYSGYGIMNKIKTNKQQYISGFIKHRFVPVYLRFAASILLFVIMHILLGTLGDYSVYEIVLSFAAWTKIGNSNWFMFATFAMYILVFVAFKFFGRKNTKNGLIAFTALTILYIVAFSLIIRKGEWWYNTILCFPAGMWFSMYIDKIEPFIKKNYIAALIVSVVAFAALYLIQDKVPYSYAYCILSVVFSAVVVLITLKVKIGNPILDFFGRHVFSIYILQRIWYIVFSDLKDNIFVYLVVTFGATIVLAVAFDFCFDNIYKKVRKK